MSNHENEVEVDEQESTGIISDYQNDSSGKLAITFENADYRVYAEVDDEGKVKARKVVSATMSDPNFEEYEKKHTDLQLELVQTFKKPIFNSIDAFLKYMDDEEEALQIVKRGVGSKFNQKINALLRDSNEDGSLVFSPTEGAYDVRELMQETSKRKSLSPIESAIRSLEAAGLPKDAIMQMIAQLQAQQAQVEG